MNIAFIVDSNKKIGGGHFYRSLNFAEFIKKNNKIFFFTKVITLKQEILLKDKKFYLKKILRKKNYFLDLKKLILDLKIDYLIIDNYQVSSMTKKKLKSFVKKLIVIDDRINVKHYSDIFINNNYLNKSDKLKIYNKNYEAKKFLGPECNFNLVPNFIHKPKKNIQNFFIFFGMIDSENYTFKVLNLLKNIKNLNLTVVVGIFNKNKKKIFSNFKTFRHIKLYENLKNTEMLKKLSKTDISIGSGGVNLIERISLGLPSIVISKIKNQENGLKNLKKKKLVFHKKLSDLNEEFFIKILSSNNSNSIFKLQKNCYKEALRLKRKKIKFIKELKKIILN